MLEGGGCIGRLFEDLGRKAEGKINQDCFM